MKISVITIAYNAAQTIEATIQSVLNQEYKNLEYIIVDGGSKDETLKIVHKYESHISTFISEKDEGVYDAMNKGLKLATGDVIAILNADDTYAHPKVLSHVVEALKKSGADSCYGDLVYVDRMRPEKITRTWISGPYQKDSFLNGWMPPHPSFFAKRQLYLDYGFFNTQLRTSADYELMLRFLFRYNATTVYINEVLVKMKMGGQSNASFKNRISANKEDRLAWKINGLKPNNLTLIKKPFRKITQFWKR